MLETPVIRYKDFIEDTRNRLKGTAWSQFLDEVKALRNHPRMLILVTHGFVELAINAIVTAKCKHAKTIKSNRNFPHAYELLILNEVGALSDHHFRLLNWLKDLRNDAAHKPHFKLTPARLGCFVHPEHRVPNKFDGLCRLIIADLWKSYEEAVGPTLAPSLYLSKAAPRVRRSKNPVPEWIPLR